MIASNDVRLRAAEPEDLELAYNLENDVRLWQYGSTSAPYSRFALKQFLEQNTADIFADKQVRLTVDVRLRETASAADDSRWTAVGFVDLNDFDPLHNRAELGMALLPGYEGRGIGQRALAQLIDYAAAIHLHTIYAIIAEDNKKASRIFELAGFTPSAHLCDWLFDGTEYHDACLWLMTIGRDRCDRRASRP